MIELGEFEKLVVAMMDESDEVRKPAEEMYEKIEKPQQVVYLFSLYKLATPSIDVKSMCLILLRRLLTASWAELWPTFSVEQQTAFKADLLAQAQECTEPTLRKRLADVISEVARYSLDEDTGAQMWIEVCQFVPACALSDLPHLKLLAMTVFESVPSLFGTGALQLDGVRGMLRACMQCSDTGVRTAAVKAYAAFMLDNDEDNTVVQKCSDLVIDMLKVVRASIENDDGDDGGLEALCDMAMSTPKALRSQLAAICDMCIRTIGNKEYEDTVRQSALEVVVSLCESSPAMMRRQGAAYIAPLIEQCMTLMAEIEEDEEWYVTDQVMDDDDEDENATIGEASLDRVATALGGKTIWHLVRERADLLLKPNRAWQHRHAALMVLSCVGEGCKKVMEPSIESIVETVVPFLQDEHMRVRYAACNALGQMSTDFAPTLQKKTHAHVVPGLLAALGNVSQPRVAAHAGAALVNFSEECPKHILTTYLDQIMTVIKQVLEATYKALMDSSGKKYVLEQVITTMASVADTSEEKFVPYYDYVMPFLKHVLVNANDPSLRLLRGKTIECISLIGLAVGADKFLPDADEIMQVLLKAQQTIGGGEEGDEKPVSDDPQVSYMMSAWARICKLMGAKFAAYLPLVMPPVLKVASFKPDITVCDSDDVDADNEEDWQFQSFGIRTAGLEDKATACEMLVCYAREMGPAFVDYVEPVVELLLPLLKFYFHDGVRESASEALPYLLVAAAPRGDEYVMALWERIFPRLLEACDKDTETEVQAEHLGALAECILKLGAPAMNVDRMNAVGNLMATLFTKHFEKCDEARKLRADEPDHDEEADRALRDEVEAEAAVIGRISDVWHALFSKCGDAVVPYFEALLPAMLRMFEHDRTPTERQWILCIFDDLIEFATPHSLRYQEYFVGPMLQSLSDEAGEVRQAASYGFGVMAMRGENAYAKVVADAMPHLATMVTRPDARTTQESSSATDNAVAAVAKILKYNSSMIDVAQVLPIFLAWLPTCDDKEESAHIYDYYCDLIENNNALVLSDLPRCVYIVVNALRREAFDETGAAVQERMRAILGQLKSNEQLFAQCVQSLDAEDRDYLNTVFT